MSQFSNKCNGREESIRHPPRPRPPALPWFLPLSLYRRQQSPSAGLSCCRCHVGGYDVVASGKDANKGATDSRL